MKTNKFASCTALPFYIRRAQLEDLLIQKKNMKSLRSPVFQTHSLNRKRLHKPLI